jgi:hypothetical protein
VSSFYPYSNNRTLIMKIHVNNNHTQGDQITYYAFVEKVYQVRTNQPTHAPLPFAPGLSFSTPFVATLQGRSSGNVVQILYQSMKDPCYTNYFNDWYALRSAPPQRRSARSLTPQSGQVRGGDSLRHDGGQAFGLR